MKSDMSLLTVRPYLGRADGFLTLHTGDGRRGGGAPILFGAGSMMLLLLAVSAVAGILGVIA